MSFARFLEGLPDYLAAKDFRAVVEAIARARRRGAPVLLGIGAHFIKVGLSPLLLQGIRDGVFTAVAMNGAGVIHDVELALAGKTSEDVAAHLQDGSFGMAGETAWFVHAALADGVPAGLGFGAAVGKAIASSKARYRKKSLLGEAYRLGVPVTVHVAVGADIVHMHPEADGAAIGKLGAVANPVNVMLTPEEVTFVVQDCGAKAVIAAAIIPPKIPRIGAERK